jgi:hypothetical protein
MAKKGDNKGIGTHSHRVTDWYFSFSLPSLGNSEKEPQTFVDNFVLWNISSGREGGVREEQVFWNSISVVQSRLKEEEQVLYTLNIQLKPSEATKFWWYIVGKETETRTGGDKTIARDLAIFRFSSNLAPSSRRTQARTFKERGTNFDALVLSTMTWRT